MEHAGATRSDAGRSLPGLCAPNPVPRPRWERRYAVLVFCCDLFCILMADLAITFGYHPPGILAGQTPTVVVVVPVAAMSSLAIQRAWDVRVLGAGVEELRRVGRAYVLATATLAVAGYAWGAASGQSWIFGALPLAAVTTVGARLLLRRVVRSRRRRGRFVRSVLVAGDTLEVHELLARVEEFRDAGWQVDGICLPVPKSDEALPLAVDDVPVLGTEDDIVGITQLHEFQAVALLPSSGWTHSKTRRLSWDLEHTGADLLMAPVLMDLVGPRLHMAPLAGLPLLQLSAPRYAGPAWVVKNIFDRVAALAIVALLAPLLLAIALAIRVTSAGPVLFRQTRVGRDGRTFTMFRFRSTVVDAEDRLPDRQDGNGILFGTRAGPRITRVGRVIRRYSLDELPQLFNVVTGDMSLVGPRPPLECEVARYGEDGARRRLFVKPGLTGLWQVSARSNLSWEESVRADLRYVENWTFALDLSILRRALRAVLHRDGAY
ncbi:sugar transferase [Rhodococcus rhodochrous]|uniref:sugar transferase n=1 Tax=Rhodococcus rhodochrous TaxID=1829 RepID=UPI0023782C22|nr:sugar transferase [Rhodococcus rhodochrous]